MLCSGDSGCASLGDGLHTCRAGACRADGAPGLGTTGSLQSALVHAVDDDTCNSGLRWTGRNRGSAEMLPGSDCVGCHRDEGARPLVVGGTVYRIRELPGLQPLDDCFGLEGVEVRFTDAAGRQFSTLTNRAGNFYIEGAESDFTLPSAASLRWTLDGEQIDTPRATMPLYGGCARCHTNEAATAPSGDFQPGPTSPDYTNLTSVIFPPGL